MTRFLLVLCCLGGPVGAQDFHRRADEGESVMATEAGDAYLAAIAPVLEESVHACAEEEARLAPGETIALVARISREGTWSSVETESASPASACFARRMQAAHLPPPHWNWERGEFPLSLRIGAGRGTVNGLRQGD
jgi:hypothetical protein